MQLNDDQLAEFEERGYLLFPGLLDGDEAAPPRSSLSNRTGKLFKQSPSRMSPP